MKRNIYQDLLSWKHSVGRKPLILQGARQVGKTYILQKFAQTEYKNHVYLNFEEDSKLEQFFTNDLDPNTILDNLATYLSLEIKAEDTLLIFDEIQECGGALTSLKYFAEKAANYHIVAAGSLLGIKMRQNDSFPVGKVNFLHLYPLDFLEFLDAIGKEKLRQYLENISAVKPLPEPIHQQLLGLLKLYMFVGGMPEVVASYVENNNLDMVRKVQNELLKSYVFDFAKHAPAAQVMKITAIWQSIPGQLAKENKKFIFSMVRKSARAREYEGAMQWLLDAGLIYKSCYVSVPRQPLSSYCDQHIFKIFLLDIGLLGAMSKLNARIVISGNDLFCEFKGAFTENFVAQELVAAQNSLYYWTSSGQAEVDFLVEDNNDNILPLEVKAGISRKKKSLLVYRDKYKPHYLLRSSLMNLNCNNSLCNYPLYLVQKFSLS